MVLKDVDCEDLRKRTFIFSKDPYENINALLTEEDCEPDDSVDDTGEQNFKDFINERVKCLSEA